MKSGIRSGGFDLHIGGTLVPRRSVRFFASFHLCAFALSFARRCERSLSTQTRQALGKERSCLAAVLPETARALPGKIFGKSRSQPAHRNAPHPGVVKRH